MFGRKKQHVPQKQIDSLIGASTTIEGDIDFVGGLRVDGRVKGAHSLLEHRPVNARHQRKSDR